MTFWENFPNISVEVLKPFCDRRHFGIVCIDGLLCSFCCCVREVTAWKQYTSLLTHMYLYSNQSLKCPVFSMSINNPRNWRASIYFFNFKQADILLASRRLEKSFGICVYVHVFLFSVIDVCMYKLRVYFLPFIIVKIVIILQIFTNIFRLVIQASDKLLWKRNDTHFYLNNIAPGSCTLSVIWDFISFLLLPNTL